MNDKKVTRVVSLCLFSIAATTVLVFLFRASPVVKFEPPNAYQVPDPHPRADSTPESPPESVLGARTRNTGLARLLDDELKGRENNFIGEVRDWARKDPEAALAWAQKQPDSDDARKEALIDACFQIAQTDPDRAVTLAERYNLDRSVVLTNLAQQWAVKDLASAYDWIAKQSDDDQRNALGTGLTLVWSKTDPVAAAQFVVQRMTPGLAQDNAVIMVLHQWALIDQPGATIWAREFPEGPLRDTALNELANMASQPQEIIGTR